MTSPAFSILKLFVVNLPTVCVDCSVIARLCSLLEVGKLGKQPLMRLSDISGSVLFQVGRNWQLQMPQDRPDWTQDASICCELPSSRTVEQVCIVEEQD